MRAAASPIFWAFLSRPLATRTESFSKAWRVFSIAASRIPPLIGQPLFALDNKNPRPRLLAGYLRHHRAGHLFSFQRGDPYRTLLPRTLCSRLDVAIDLLVAPSFEPNEVPRSPLPQQSQVLDGPHPPVTHKDHPPQPE